MSLVTRVYNFSLQLLLAVFPFSTAWIYQEIFVDGVKWQYATLLWHMSEGLLAVCVISCCLYLYTTRIKGKVIKFTWTKDRLLVIFLALFCIYLYINSFFTLYPDIAWQQSVHVLEAILFFFCLLLSPLKVNTLLRALIVGAVFQAVLGIMQFFLQTTWSSTLLGTSAHLATEAGSSVIVTQTQRWLRAYGTFTHPNIYGGYLASVLVLFLYSFQFSVSKQISDFNLVARQNNVWQKSLIFKSFVIVLLTTGIFVSFSRSAWLVLFLGLLFLSFRLKPRRGGVKWRNPFLITLSQNEMRDSITTSKGSLGYARDDKNIITRFAEASARRANYSLLITTICTFGFLAIVFSPLVFNRINISTLNEQQSITERISGNREAVELIQNNIWFGVGPMQYTPTLMQIDSSRPIWEYQPVHNVFLLVFTEVGVVGILLLILSLTTLCLVMREDYLLRAYPQQSEGVPARPQQSEGGFFVKAFQIQFIDLLFAIPFIPLILFDHYLWSSLVGLFMLVVYIGFIIRIKKET